MKKLKPKPKFTLKLINKEIEKREFLPLKPFIIVTFCLTDSGNTRATIDQTEWNHEGALMMTSRATRPE